jgi:anaphase-promoting complex subunit 1
MDTKTTKLLSVHIEALLPPTAVELDVPQNIQVAALMGIGLVYMGTAKRHIAEVLLQEIGRPPGPEMENYVERESYSLTAGLALGMVVLGQSEAPTGLKDLNLADTLHYYMVGGNKRPLTGAQKEKYKLPSFQIREGTTVNIDITAPGATLALGLIYFRTGNEAIANWMKPPDTKYLLNFLRPDLLLLRVLARGLIMWDSIEPTAEWIYSEVPLSLRKLIKQVTIQQVLHMDDQQNQDIDHESNFQAYSNIITGAAFIMGLRYAGTGNQEAFKALKKHLETFISGSMSGPHNEYSGKATIESCSVMILLALSLVFAGTGNLEILRIIRMMRARIGQSNSHVTYGSHMAIHMALGFLFLGGGRYTISRKPEAIAALICALFPKFPNHSNDNRYHLQAFRHLYVLALEPRLVLPREIKSGKLCLCHISYIELNPNQMSDEPDQLISMMAPCMLPELDTIKAICIDDPHYWPVKFEINRNWDQLL